MKSHNHFHPATALHKSVRGFLPAALLLGLLAGCASERVFENCSALPDRDNAEESLIRVQQLLRQDPQSVGCQRAQLLLRERLVSGYLRRAEQERQESHWGNAVALYRRVLDMQPGQSDAQLGLATVARMERIQSLIGQAQAAMQDKDWGQARNSLEAVLRVDANHQQAKALLADTVRLSAPIQTDGGLSAAYKKPITIEFRDVPIRMVFDVVSKSSGLNFVFDKDVKTDQKTSIFLRDSTVESALYFLLLTNQLEQQVMNGNTILIYPNLPAKQKEYQELTVRTFQLVNADVKAVAAALKTLFKGRDMVVDEKLNMLTVRDTPEAIRAVEKLIALHDIAEPEVMLEVEILEVSRDRLLNLGVDLPGSFALTPLASGTNLTINDLRNLNRNTVGVDVGSLTVNAKKTNTDINILANPRIRVVNREKAKIQIGEKVPVISAVATSNTAIATESVSYVDVGLKLDVEPIIYRGSDIILKIGLEVSNISGTTISKLGSVAYSFGTRNANTTLRLRDGENQVLAGLINDEDRKVASKLPGVGEMPVVGRLFGTQEDSGKKTEIILSITPRLTRRTSMAEGTTPEFRSGTESSMRERPLPVAALLAAPLTRAAPPAMLSAPVVAAPAPVPLAAVPVTPTQAAPTLAPVQTSAPRTPMPEPVQQALAPAPQTAPPAPVPLPAPVAPTAAERELAAIALSALKTYSVTRQVSQSDTLPPWDGAAERNKAVFKQGGQ